MAKSSGSRQPKCRADVQYCWPAASFKVCSLAYFGKHFCGAFMICAMNEWRLLFNVGLVAAQKSKTISNSSNFWLVYWKSGFEDAAWLHLQQFDIKAVGVTFYLFSFLATYTSQDSYNFSIII